MTKLVFLVSLITFAITPFAHAESTYCGTIEVLHTGSEPSAYLAVFESIFFTGQVNRFKLVSKNSSLLSELKGQEGENKCVDAELVSVSGETVLRLKSAE
jgi:hypothetical protein